MQYINLSIFFKEFAKISTFVFCLSRWCDECTFRRKKKELYYIILANGFNETKSKNG